MAAGQTVPGDMRGEPQRATTAAESDVKPVAASAGGAFRKGAVLPTALCLTKAAVGAGILGISLQAAQVGVLYAVICLALAGCLTVVSIRMLAQASVATGRWSFEDICEDLFHPAMSLFTGFVNAANCLGAAASYLIIGGQVFVVATGAGEAWRRAFIAMVGILINGPLALAPHVSFMRYLAAASATSIVLLALVIATQVGEDGVNDSLTSETFWYGGGEATILMYMNAISVIVWAYNNQFNVPQLTGELTPKPDSEKMTLVGLISTFISMLLYTSVSLVGVLAFGVYDQKDSLIVDLFPYRHRPAVIVANLAVMFSVITCFQFHIYPIRQFLAYIVRSARGRPAGDEKSDRLFWGMSLTRLLDMICGVGAVLVSMVVALTVKRLTLIMTFFGAFAGSWVSYVVPPLFVLQIRKGADDFSWFSAEAVACGLLFSLGVFLFVFGTYAALAA